MKKDNAPPENSTISTDIGTVDYCDSYRIKKTTDGNVKEIANQLFKIPK